MTLNTVTEPSEDVKNAKPVSTSDGPNKEITEARTTSVPVPQILPADVTVWFAMLLKENVKNVTDQEDGSFPKTRMIVTGTVTQIPVLTVTTKNYVPDVLTQSVSIPQETDVYQNTNADQPELVTTVTTKPISVTDVPQDTLKWT